MAAANKTQDAFQFSKNSSLSPSQFKQSLAPDSASGSTKIMSNPYAGYLSKQSRHQTAASVEHLKAVTHQKKIPTRNDNPNLMIVGGNVSRKSDKPFARNIKSANLNRRPSKFRNQVIGSIDTIKVLNHYKLQEEESKRNSTEQQETQLPADTTEAGTADELKQKYQTVQHGANSSIQVLKSVNSEEFNQELGPHKKT